MKKFLWTLKNIFKITLWIVFLFILMNYLGMIKGIALFSFICLGWNLFLTLLRTYRIFGLESFKIVIKTLFTSYFYLPFIAYGCFCSPKYGLNWRTANLVPIDGLDEACKRHDEAMYHADWDLKTSLINNREHASRKNIGDWTFMKEAMTSKNYANGIYLLFFEIGFLFRIIIRTIRKMFM